MKRPTSSILATAICLIVMLLPLVAVTTTAVEAQQAKSGARIKIEAEDGSEVELYDESHALLIGAINYKNGWRTLPGVERDIIDISEALNKHGFQVEILKDPTRAKFDQAVRQFIRDWGQAGHNRLVIYFAGHGHTLKTLDEVKLGYIVPIDAPLPSRDDGAFREKPVGMRKVDIHKRERENGLFKEKAVSVSEIVDVYALQIESMHALFVFDSCFAGTLFSTMRGLPSSISSKVAKPVRQFITAGTDEQEVPDDSIFREEFVEALDGGADLNQDGYVTGSELGEFLENKVKDYSKGTQTPQYGKIKHPNLDKGDFIFILKKPKAKVGFSPRGFKSSTVPVSFSPAGAAPQNRAYTLSPGDNVENTLRPGWTESYELKLAAGEYLRVVVEQQGIDVMLVLTDPQGRKVAEVDGPNGAQGPETITLIAESSGAYGLDVTSVDEKAVPGKYKISVSELRLATRKERSLLRVEKLSEQLNDLYVRGRHDEALRVAQEVLAVCEQELGPDEPATAEALRHLGVLYFEGGDHKRAEPLLLRALSVSEKAGPDNTAVGSLLNNLAALYEAAGDYSKAETFYERALRAGEKTEGADSLHVAKILNDLGVILEARGDYARALNYHLRALEIRAKAAGQDSAAVAVSLNNLASLFEAQGDLSRAEYYYRRVLGITERVYGVEHPYVAQSLHNLAALYYTKGDYVSAEPLLQRALAINRQGLGPEHPAVAQSLDNLGSIYRAKGEYEKSAQLFMSALAIREKSLGAEHPSVAITLSNLGTLYLEKGDYGRAEPLLQRGLMIREKGLGRGHPYVAQSLESLGILYRLRKENMRALDYFTRELAVLRSAGDKRGEIQTLNNMGGIYQSSGDKQKALQYYKQAQMLELAMGGHTAVQGIAAMPALGTASSVTITDPPHNDVDVGNLITVSGTASLVQGNHLWLLVRRVDRDNDWRPLEEPPIDPQSHQWSTTFTLSLREGGRAEFEIAAITVDDRGHAALRDYLWPGKRAVGEVFEMPPLTSPPQFRRVRIASR